MGESGTLAGGVGAEEMQMALGAPEVIIRSETMEEAVVINNGEFEFLPLCIC
jgi:hypothetical protein